MAVITDSVFDDVLNTTLRNYSRGKFNDFASKFQYYEAYKRIIRSEGETLVGGSEGFTFDALTATDNNAAMVGLADVDDVNFSNGTKKGFIPWRRAKTAWTMERRLRLENKGINKLYDLVEVNQAKAEIALAEILENNYWGGPSSSADLLSLWGVKQYMQLRDAATIASDAAGTTTGGFTTKVPTGFSDIAGLDPVTLPRWRNWAGAYTQYTKPDVLTKMRVAALNCRFESPVDVPDYEKGRGNMMRVYVPFAVKLGLETIGEGQNENLGRDLASMSGDLQARFNSASITFRGSPILPVPALNPTDLAGNALAWGAHYPILMINYAWAGVKFLEGDMFRMSDAIMDPLRHNWTRVFTDATLNPYFFDRSRQACIYQSVNSD